MRLNTSDPTANQAVGAVNREWNKMVNLALSIRKNEDPVKYRLESRKFTGIFKRLLDMPLAELETYQKEKKEII